MNLPPRLATHVVWLAAITASGCVRDVPEIEGPIEGTFVRGRVVERRADSGALVGVSELRVGLFGTSLSTRTDEDGSFSLVRLPKGNFRLRIERQSEDGTFTLLRSVGGISLLVDRQQLSLGDIDVGGQGDLRGQVELADDPRTDAAEGSLVVVAETSFRGVVNGEGAYRVAGVPAGDFDVVAFRAGYTPGRAGGVQVEASATKELALLSLLPSDDNQLYVVENRAMLLDDSGEALASSDGVSVQLVSETSTATTFRTETDAAGTYKFQAPSGVYRVRFEKSGFAPLELYGVAVLPEGTLGLVPVFLSPSSAIALPQDRDGDGCADAQDAFPDDPRYCLDLDGDGIPDAIDADIDGDGLSNLSELELDTDPRLRDSDGDGAEDAADLCPTTFEETPNRDSDGDGVGDACDEEPIITDFFPKRGGPGSRVTLIGDRFSRLRERNVVVFSPGIVVPVIDATPTQLVVEVIGAVETGPILVSNGLGSGQGPEDFVRLPQPVIEQVVPGRAQPGQLVRIYGRRFRADPADTTVSVSFQGTAGTSLPVEVPIIDDAGRERVEVNAPTALGTYLIRLIGSGGQATTSPALVVSDGPVILAVQPARAPTGVRIQIEGRNFAVGPDMSVEFGDTDGVPGGAGSVVALDPSAVGLDGRQLTVVVPADATTGPITVRLPNGEATSSFEVDPLATVADSMDPELVIEGETLTVFFRNVAPADGVSFELPGTSGPLMVPASGTVPGGRTLVVPSGVRAGSVTAVVTKSGSTSERIGVPQSLGVIRTATASTEWYQSARPVYWARGPNQDQVMVFGSVRENNVNSDFKLRALLSAPGQPGDLALAAPDRLRAELGWVSNTDPPAPEAHPTRPRAVYANLSNPQPDNGRLVTFDLETGRVIGVCGNQALSTGVRLAFDPLRSRAVASYGYFGTGGLVFIDLETGACQRVDWTGIWAPQEQTGQLVFLEDRLFHLTNQQRVYEVEHQLPSSDPSFGRPVAELPRLPSGTSVYNGAVGSYDRTKIWAGGVNSLSLIDPLTGTVLSSHSDFRNEDYNLFSIGRGRFIAFDSEDTRTLVLLDGLTQRIRRIHLPSLYPGVDYSRPGSSYTAIGAASPVPHQDGDRERYDAFIVVQPGTNARHLLRISIEVAR